MSTPHSTPVVLSFVSGFIKPPTAMELVAGQPAAGLCLHVLMEAENGRESTLTLQIEEANLWALLDVCADVAPTNYGRYIAFMGKKSGYADAADKAAYLKTLPSSDPFPRFQRRKGELTVPPGYLTGVHDAASAHLQSFAQFEEGLDLTFGLTSGTAVSMYMPNDIVFLLNEEMGDAVYAAEWKRKNWLA